MEGHCLPPGLSGPYTVASSPSPGPSPSSHGWVTLRGGIRTSSGIQEECQPFRSLAANQASHVDAAGLTPQEQWPAGGVSAGMWAPVLSAGAVVTIQPGLWGSASPCCLVWLGLSRQGRDSTGGGGLQGRNSGWLFLVVLVLVLEPGPCKAVSSASAWEAGDRPKAAGRCSGAGSSG